MICEEYAIIRGQIWLNTVLAFRKTMVDKEKKMNDKKKVSPFNILDEMMPSINIGNGEKNLAAFQRNM